MILPVLRVYAGDESLVLANLEACAALDSGQRNTSLAISYDVGFDVTRVNESAQRVFKSLIHIPIDSYNGERQWPHVQNYVWQRTARYLSAHAQDDVFSRFSGWLWWEADACPIRSKWLESLSAAHETRPRKLFSGHVCRDSITDFYIPGGCAIWPMDVVEPLADCAALYARDSVFDRCAGQLVSRSCRDLSTLMLHHLKWRGGESGKHFTSRDFVELLRDNADAVYYHGSADGSLPAVITGKSVNVTSTTPDVTLNRDTAPLYTISILCFNNASLTERCLKSVVEHSRNTHYEIIVTNNASTDGTATLLKRYKKQLGPRLRVLTNTSNKGFQEPNTYALTLARGRYFVLLNNDIEVCENWLDALHAPFSSDAKLALTGIADTCSIIDDTFKGKPATRLQSPEYIEGSCLMIPTTLARRHTLFAPYLKFAYFEDTDLSLRLRELGYNIATVPLAINHHERSSTSRHLDLREVVEHNRKSMWERWGFYIARRHFKRRILVRRRGAHGDVLLMTPALRALHTKWPQAQIDVETVVGNVLTSLDYVRVVTQPDVKNYDHIYDLDLAYEKRPDVHITKAFADALQVNLPDAWRLELPFSDADRAWAEHVTRDLNVALIHPGPTTWPGKNWPEERWRVVVTSLRKAGYFTITVGGRDAPLCGCDDAVSGDTTPQQLVALCAQSKLFVGLDSFPQHVAASQQLRAVVLFGATSPERIIAPTCTPIQAPRSAAPCIGAHGRRVSPILDITCDGACMLAITPRMVMDALPL